MAHGISTWWTARREKCHPNRRNSQVDRGSACTLFQGGDDQKVVNFEQILFASGRIAPVCADKFPALPDADAERVALSKVKSWKRRDELPKEFVTLPGESYSSSALVDACYALLFAPKSAALK